MHLIDSIRLQVRFALASSPVFSRSDTATDSERFYNSVLDLFGDPDEQGEVNDLLVWWNRCFFSSLSLQRPLTDISRRQIFPIYSSARRPVCKDSALAKIKERRAALKERTNNLG